ncbi:MAG: acyl-ACP--UDP-N-acetylglucosamine O-acyltransferase [Elusimicrobia bacterium]|nr:acyl-ACP--UDP-N-acetylglucosamine O-acyltransferase [Elusimicrobiota bacterium]
MISDKAQIAKSAVIGKNVEIAPFASVEENVRIMDGAVIGHGAVIGRNTIIGEGTKVSPYAVLGTPPQDLKYAGEETSCEIGKNCTIREFVTVNRGTTATGKTIVGDNALLMAYVHVAHDCRVGNGVIMSNCVGIAGHVSVGESAIMGAYAAVHQFTRIGELAMVGGTARINQDVPPYSMIAGSPAYVYGLNRIGLTRAGFSTEELALLKKAYRIIFRSSLLKEEALKEAEKLRQTEPVKRLIEFVRNSKRGITPSK